MSERRNWAKERNKALGYLTEHWGDTGLPAGALVVLGALFSYSSPRSSLVWPHIRTMASESFSKSSVDRGLNDLLEFGIVVRNGDGDYDLIPLLAIAEKVRRVVEVRRLGFKQPRAFIEDAANNGYLAYDRLMKHIESAKALGRTPEQIWQGVKESSKERKPLPAPRCQAWLWMPASSTPGFAHVEPSAERARCVEEPEVGPTARSEPGVVSDDPELLRVVAAADARLLNRAAERERRSPDRSGLP